MSSRPLYYNDGPLVWVDCEMTGLDPSKDKIIEIAVLITNGNLELVDSGMEYVIRTDKDVLDGTEWTDGAQSIMAKFVWLSHAPTCLFTFFQSGLTQACLDSPHTLEFVAGEVLKYIKKWIPRQRDGVLAGNSVHVDRLFLAAEMPAVIEWLHYRIVDVSSIKELSRRWYAREGIPPIPVENKHRALDDIIGSIKELQWYRQNIFAAPSTILERSMHSQV